MSNNVPIKINEIAGKYSVSLRTARRYAKLVQLPPPPETWLLGRDGKRYPPSGGWYQSTLHRPLAIARANIRRAVRADKFRDGDLVILKEIVTEDARLL